MRKVIWTDKELVALRELIDVQGLIESYMQKFALNLLYSSSGLLGPVGFKVTPTSPAPSGSVVVPAFVAVQSGNIIKTANTTMDVLTGTVNTSDIDIDVIPLGAMPNIASKTPRRDVIVCRYETTTGDPQDIWRIDPATNTKSKSYENSRQLDSYRWGIIRGVPDLATPKPHVPAEWFEVAQVVVQNGIPIIDGSTPYGAGIVSAIPSGAISDLMDPIKGHRHFGVLPLDAPKLIHGTGGAGLPVQSFDKTTILPNDHHNQVHGMSSSDHQPDNFLLNSLHGFLTNVSPAPFSGALHDFSAFPGFNPSSPTKLSATQHGELPSVIGGANILGQLHANADVTLPTPIPGFMSPADKIIMNDISSSGLNMTPYIISGITTFAAGTQVEPDFPPGVRNSLAPPLDSSVTVEAIIRGRALDGSYSQWHTIPFNIGTHSGCCSCYFNIKNNKICFSMKNSSFTIFVLSFSGFGGGVFDQGIRIEAIITETNPQGCLMYDVNGVLKSNWVEWEIRYIVDTKV